jgi:hypothetical protein
MRLALTIDITGVTTRANQDNNMDLQLSFLCAYFYP